VRDATGEADRVPSGGRAMQVLDVSGDERSSESGMQHLRLLLPVEGFDPAWWRNSPTNFEQRWCPI
jgi:hypothetical protein